MPKHKFRSNSEYNTYCFLKENKVSFKYEKLIINYEWLESKKYIPDFVLSNGIILEVKGRFVLEDRKKHVLIRDQYPDMDLRILFENPNGKINKGSKTTYGMWCDKNGIKWSKRGPKGNPIPQEWLDED